MDLPRRTDEKSAAYWKMIDQAAERVKKISDRQVSNVSFSATSSPKSERDPRPREERRQGS